LVRLNKIYTRGGDSGFTSLGDGTRVKKNIARIKACGEMDEANSSLGVAMCFCSKPLKKILTKIQNDLFDIGADLCVPKNKRRKIKNRKFLSEKINFLEQELDKLNKKLGNLKSFILPGGTEASSFLHLSRTIIRRAERSVVDLSLKEDINPEIIKYVNRLSDFLFVAARFENKKVGDILWIPNGKQSKD
jgi:cob(I)alamin adenosyltransferase